MNAENKRNLITQVQQSIQLGMGTKDIHERARVGFGNRQVVRDVVSAEITQMQKLLGAAA